MSKTIQILPMRFTDLGRVYSSAIRRSTPELVRYIARIISRIPANQFGYKVVALGGPSSVGKTYLAERLQRDMGSAVAIKMDRWRGPLLRNDLTEAEFIEVLGLRQFREDFLLLMQNGELQSPPKYVKFTTIDQPREYEREPLIVKGRQIVIIDGLIALHHDICDLSQLKISMFADSSLRHQIRVSRGRTHLPQGPKFNLSNRYSVNSDLVLWLERQANSGAYRHLILEE